MPPWRPRNATEVAVTLRELMEMQPGDIIPVELPEVVSARVEGVPVLQGKFGVSRGNMALKVVESLASHSKSSALLLQESDRE